MQVLERVVFNQDLFFILLLFSFFLLAILKAFYWKFSRLLFMGVFGQRYANQYLREDNAFTERVSILTFILMLLNFSLLLMKLKHHQTAQEFLFIFVFIGGFYLLKFLIIRLLGETFLMNELAKLGIFFSFMFDRVIAICLFPFLVFLFFGSISEASLMLFSSFMLFILFVLLKIICLWRIGTNAFGLSPLYIFLYLCLLEIFPLAILAKGLVY